MGSSACDFCKKTFPNDVLTHIRVLADDKVICRDCYAKNAHATKPAGRKWGQKTG